MHAPKARPRETTCVNLVPFAAGSGAERLVALGDGSIDAAIFRAPHDNFADRAGFTELLDVNKAGLYNPASCIGTTKSYVRANRDSAMRLVKGFVEGLKFFKENRDFAFKVASEMTRTTDAEALSAVLDSPARLQEKSPTCRKKASNFCSRSKRRATRARSTSSHRR